MLVDIFFWVKVGLCAFLALAGVGITVVGSRLVYRELWFPSTRQNALQVGGSFKLESSSVGTICIALGLLSIFGAIQSAPTGYERTENSLRVSQVQGKARLLVSLPTGKTLADISDAELATAISFGGVLRANGTTASALSMPLTGVAIRNEGNGTYRLISSGMPGAVLLIADPSEGNQGTATFVVRPADAKTSTKK